MYMLLSMITMQYSWIQVLVYIFQNNIQKKIGDLFPRLSNQTQTLVIAENHQWSTLLRRRVVVLLIFKKYLLDSNQVSGKLASSKQSNAAIIMIKIENVSAVYVHLKNNFEFQYRSLMETMDLDVFLLQIPITLLSRKLRLVYLYISGLKQSSPSWNNFFYFLLIQTLCICAQDFHPHGWSCLLVTAK